MRNNLKDFIINSGLEVIEENDFYAKIKVDKDKAFWISHEQVNDIMQCKKSWEGEFPSMFNREGKYK